MRNKYICKEPKCNNTISEWNIKYGSGNCKSCANKKRPRTAKKYHCIDCGKEISGYRAIRCLSCAKTIHGRTLKMNNCIDCDKEISYGAKRCQKCLINHNQGKNHPFFGKCHNKETKSKMSLSKGGTGIPYELTEYGTEFDSILKEQVRFRDGYKCQICGCSQLENARQLDCHHIDYDKKNNLLTNLISLCMKCHRKTNFNRNYWKIFLKRRRKCYV